MVPLEFLAPLVHVAPPVPSYRYVTLRTVTITFKLSPQSQHQQYISERSHDDHMSYYELFKLPSMEETIDDILAESFPSDHVTAELDHMSSSYCLPLIDTSKTGRSKRYPAYDCEHIQRINTTAASGYYWIDPNLGCSADAIVVYCNFSSNATCLYPQEKKVCPFHSDTDVIGVCVCVCLAQVERSPWIPPFWRNELKEPPWLSVLTGQEVRGHCMQIKDTPRETYFFL